MPDEGDSQDSEGQGPDKYIIVMTIRPGGRNRSCSQRSIKADHIRCMQELDDE